MNSEEISNKFKNLIKSFNHNSDKKNNTKFSHKVMEEEPLIEYQEEAVPIVDDPDGPKNTKSTVVSLMILSAFTKIFGFIREIVLARYYGVGNVAEAYKIAQTIPIIILMIVGTGLATGFIPTYNKALAEKGNRSANDFTVNTINIVIILGLLFSIIVNIFPNLFVKIFATGFTGEKLRLAILFTRIAVFGTVFSMINYILQPYLNIKNNFWVPAMVGIPMNLVLIATYPLAKNININILPIGIVISILVQVIWLWPFAVNKGLRYKPLLDTNDDYVKHLLILATPVILGVAVNQINVIVDKNMASRIIDGGVAALDYANRMNGFVQGVFIYSVVAVVYPSISRMFIKKDYKGVESTMTNSMVSMSMIVIPCIVGLMVFAEPIVKFLFLRGEFDERAAQLTSGGMFWYAPGLIGFGLREILARVFYSMNDTKTPTINAAIAVVINIVFNITLSSFIGLNGLAMATSLASILGSLLLMISLRRKGKLKIHYRELLIKLIKITGAAVAMGIVSYAVFVLTSHVVSYKLGLIVSIMAAVVMYAVTVIQLGIPEVDEMIQLVRAKIKR